MKAGGLLTAADVARCAGCGAWNVKGRACPTCQDFADRLLSWAAWAAVVVLYAAMSLLLLLWAAPTS